MFIYYVYILLCLYIKLCLYIIYVLIGRLSLWSIKMIEKYISSSRSSFKRRGNFEKQREEIYKNDRKVYIVLEILVQEQPWKTERRDPPTLRCIVITLKNSSSPRRGIVGRLEHHLGGNLQEVRPLQLVNYSPALSDKAREGKKRVRILSMGCRLRWIPL